MTATTHPPRTAPASTHAIAGAINATKRYGKGDTAVPRSTTSPSTSPPAEFTAIMGPSRLRQVAR